LASGLDPELGEHVPQMPLDGASTEEHAGTDFRVGESIAGELGDLALLRGEIIAGRGDSPTRPFARGEKLATGTIGERLHPH
jgi:hypothetical protein